MKTNQNISIKTAPHVESITFDGVSYSVKGLDPILTLVDFQFPMDKTVVLESSNPQASLQLLQIISGALAVNSGKVLWNNEDVFSDESEFDPREVTGVYFEKQSTVLKMPVEAFLKHYFSEAEIDNITEQFELSSLLDKKMNELSYGDYKLLLLVRTLAQTPEILFLEDPAQGLKESQWLNFLDYLQYYQRRGFCRHVFMTNHHPIALNHLEHQKIYIEDGVLYFDETTPPKKVAHF